MTKPLKPVETISGWFRYYLHLTPPVLVGPYLSLDAADRAGGYAESPKLPHGVSGCACKIIFMKQFHGAKQRAEVKALRGKKS